MELPPDVKLYEALQGEGMPPGVRFSPEELEDELAYHRVMLAYPKTQDDRRSALSTVMMMVSAAHYNKFKEPIDEFYDEDFIKTLYEKVYGEKYIEPVKPKGVL